MNEQFKGLGAYRKVDTPDFPGERRGYEFQVGASGIGLKLGGDPFLGGSLARRLRFARCKK